MFENDVFERDVFGKGAVSGEGGCVEVDVERHGNGGDILRARKRSSERTAMAFIRRTVTGKQHSSVSCILNKSCPVRSIWKAPYTGALRAGDCALRRCS